MLRRILLSLKRNWLLFIVITLFTSSIIWLEIILSTNRSQTTLNEVSNHLTTMADLKAVQIQNWRSERLIDGQTIQTDVAFSDEIHLLMQDRSDYQVIKKNLDRLRTILLDPNYSSILLIDGNGNEVLHIGEVDDKPRINVIDNISIIDLTRSIQISNLYKAANGTVRMDMIAPIFLKGDQYQPISAYLVYIINPDVVLYPLIQSQHTTYNTAETLLVRKENNEVVYLNELRYKNGTALELKLPLSETQVPAVMAVNGITGIVNGNDYRSIPVMASIVPVEGTDWKLIAKIDMKEIYTPIRQQIVSTVIVVIFLIIIGVTSVIYLWRRSSASVTKGLSDSEKLRKNLEEKYSTLFNQANDAILLVDETGRILEANAQAVKMYGYTHNELINLSVSDLRDDSLKHKVPTDLEKVKNGSVNFFETTQKRKNGKLFQVDISSRYLSIDGKGVFQSMIRDITEKKQAEENLRLSELALKKAQSVSHVGSWRWNLQTDKIDLSDELFTIFGLQRQKEGLNFNQFEQYAIHPYDYERIRDIRITAINEKRIFFFESKIVRPDGKEKYIRVEAGELVCNSEGQVLEVYGIAQDVTEMKAAERELRKSENLLQRIYDLLPVGLWITDKNGKLIRSNKMVKEIWGKDILVSINDFEIFHGRRLPSREEIQPEDWASVHTIRDGVTIRDEMVEIDAYDGKTKTILNYSTPILDDSGKMEGAIVLNLDITELKKAEELLSAQLDELRRWNLATLGRENRIRELKMEINKLLVEIGREPIYQSVVDDDHE
jgi:PAS domain S-box-containing protein